MALIDQRFSRTPGVDEGRQGSHSAGRVRTFSVSTHGSSRNIQFDIDAVAAGTFLVGEEIVSGAKRGYVRNVTGTGASGVIQVEQYAGTAFANADAITGSTSGATGVLAGRTRLDTPAQFNSDRAILGGTPVNLVWPTRQIQFGIAAAPAPTGAFQAGEFLDGTGGAAGKRATIVSVTGTGADQVIVIQPLVGNFANADTVAGSLSGATGGLEGKALLSSGAEWIKLTKTGLGASWRTSRLPFPCTPCITILTLGLAAAAGTEVRLRVSGVGQFGEAVVETLPAFKLATTVLSPLYAVLYSRIWCSKVFSAITMVEYQLSGTATPAGATIMVGQFFTWDLTLSESTLDVTPTGMHYYFPFNQGIGTQIRIAGTRGNLGYRYPEVLNVTLRKPAGGPGNTAQIFASGEIGDLPFGFDLGTAPDSQFGSGSTDALTTLTRKQFEGDSNKIILWGTSKQSAYAGAAGRIKFWDETSGDPYTPAAGNGEIDNPLTLIYDFTIRTDINRKGKLLTTSVNPVT